MPRRTQVYQKMPWTGGLNDSVDKGILPDNDLVIADNVVFTTSGARIKREGMDFYDTEIPAITFRSSSGTTRTLVFASSINTASDHILVVGEKVSITGTPADYLVTAGAILTITTTTVSNDTITYTGGSSLNEANTATSGLTLKRSQPYIALHDYWRTDSSYVKQQLIVAISDQGKIFTYNTDGERLEITKHSTATSYATTITRCHTEVFNERLIIAFDGLGNTPKMFHPETDADEYFDLTGSPPDFSIMREHLGRLWTDQKDNKDRLHYCETGNHAKWLGIGDSGALDISPGDGDPLGLQTIFPPFKGVLFVAKSQKNYQISGDSPENFQVIPVSNGVGSVSHKAVVGIDLDDIFYASTKGFHSIQTTANYGDFAGTFLSQKIQNAFNSWNQGRLRNTQAAYIPGLNSVAFSIAANGQSAQSDLWFFNTMVKEWYRWPDISCQSIAAVLIGNERKLMVGTANSRLIETQNGERSDFTDTPFLFRVKSGTIYADQSPMTMKAFKSLSCLFRPLGDFTFTVKFKIDNHSPQAFSFAQTASGAILGTTFVLGTSILGTDNTFAPFTQTLDGLGRGFSIEIESSGSGDEIEMYGFAVEYENLDLASETLEA